MYVQIDIFYRAGHGFVFGPNSYMCCFSVTDSAPIIPLADVYERSRYMNQSDISYMILYGS